MDLQITIDLTALHDLRRISTSFPRLRAEVQVQTLKVQQVWASAAYGMRLPGMTRAIHDEKYRNAITSSDALEYPFNGDQFMGAVIARYAGIDRIENGYASFDMKPGLLSGPKSRPTADGKGRYNIVPFRHGTPGDGDRAHMPTMPQEVYKYLLNARRTGKTQAQINRGGPGGMSLEEYGKRSKVMVVVNKQWVNRNEGVSLAEAPMQDNYTWKSGMYQGIKNITKVNQEGKLHSSQWTTFRVVSTPRTKTIKRGPRRGQVIRVGSDPNSWIHPGMAPNPVVQSVFQYMRGHVEEALMQAARQDLGMR